MISGNTRKFDAAKFKVDSKKYQQFLKWRASLKHPDNILIKDAPQILRMIELCDAVKNGIRITPEQMKEYYQALAKLAGLPSIKYLQETLGDEELRNRMQRAVTMLDLRPGDMGFLEFVAHPDLKYMDGEFSTYDAKLARNFKSKNVSKSKKLAELAKRIVYQNDIAREYATRWLELTKPDSKLMAPLIANGLSMSADEYAQKLQGLVYLMMTAQGIIYDDMTVTVVDSWADTPKDVQETAIDHTTPDGSNDSVAICTITPSKSPKHAPRTTIYINRKRAYDSLPRECKNNRELWIEMVSALAHEYSHFIDNLLPNLGAMGAQKSHIRNKLYNTKPKTMEEYYSNPSESMAFTVEHALTRELHQK